MLARSLLCFNSGTEGGMMPLHTAAALGHLDPLVQPLQWPQPTLCAHLRADTRSPHQPYKLHEHASPTLLKTSRVHLPPHRTHRGVYIHPASGRCTCTRSPAPLPLQVPHLRKGPGRQAPVQKEYQGWTRNHTAVASKEPLPYTRHRATGSAASKLLGQDP